MKDRGWTIDVLNCVQDLEKKEFTFKEMYGYTDKLAFLHPRNQHVQPKIRQQLQVLRDHGIPDFVKRGVYRII